MIKTLPDTKISSYIPNLTSVLCPTRNRPGQLIAMMQSCLEKASNPNLIEFCLYIDNDDLSYDVNKLYEVSAKIKIVRGPKMSLSSMFNSLLTVANGEFFFWSGDDVSFQSSYWDESLKTPLIGISDRLGVAHANDLASYEQKNGSLQLGCLIWICIYASHEG
jgi:hypothetical protein